jgi:hypothetical protein
MEHVIMPAVKEWLSEFFGNMGSRRSALLVEGEDSSRIWRARLAKGEIVLSPAGNGDKPGAPEEQGSRSHCGRSDVIACVPRRGLVFRWLSLPATEREELDGMVRFEASDALPFPAREAVYDYCRLRGSEDGFSRVLLIGVSRGKLDEHVGRTGEWGHLLRRIVPSSVALQAVAEALPGTQERCAILVDVTNTHVETIALHRGDLLFGREAPAGENGPTIQTALSSLHMAHEKLPPDGDLLVLLHCAPEIEETMRAEIKTHLDCEIRALDAETLKTALRYRVEGLEDGWPAPSLRMLGLAVIALRHDSPSINLLPAERRAALHLRVRRIRGARTAAAAVLCLLLFATAGRAAMGRTERRIQILENEVRRIGPVAREVESKRAELKLIREQLNRGFSPLALVMEVYRTTPSGVTLSQMVIDSQRGVTLHGQALALSQAFDYLAVLEDCDLVERAEARYAEKRPVGDKEIVDFEFFLTLRASLK